MDKYKLEIIINYFKEEMAATGGNLAGLPPDEPPVDLRKKKYKRYPYFYRGILKKR